jgi:hypothetical protein
LLAERAGWVKYGKSAISQAVAEMYAAQGRLAASFFFLQGAGNRSVITGLIPTIASQLSVSFAATKPFIQSKFKVPSRLALALPVNRFRTSSRDW